MEYPVSGIFNPEDPSTPAGYMGGLDYAIITYAPGVGPIHTYERKLVSIADDYIDTGFGEVECWLSDYGNR